MRKKTIVFEGNVDMNGQSFPFDEKYSHYIYVPGKEAIYGASRKWSGLFVTEDYFDWRWDELTKEHPRYAWLKEKGRERYAERCKKEAEYQERTQELNQLFANASYAIQAILDSYDMKIELDSCAECCSSEGSIALTREGRSHRL